MSRPKQRLRVGEISARGELDSILEFGVFSKWKPLSEGGLTSKDVMDATNRLAIKIRNNAVPARNLGIAGGSVLAGYGINEWGRGSREKDSRMSKLMERSYKDRQRTTGLSARDQLDTILFSRGRFATKAWNSAIQANPNGRRLILSPLEVGALGRDAERFSKYRGVPRPGESRVDDAALMGSVRDGLARKLRRHRAGQFSARSELDLILFGGDPRPRNNLGMFTGTEEGGPSPDAIDIVYKQQPMDSVSGTDAAIGGASAGLAGAAGTAGIAALLSKLKRARV